MPGKIMPICPICGSKNVKAMGGFYRCKECAGEFGRPALTDDGRPMVDAVKGIRFRYGNVFTGSSHLRIAEDAGSVVYEVYYAGDGKVTKVADVLPMEKWENLKKKLFEEQYVNDWQRSYIPVNDGQRLVSNDSWELSIIVNEDEEVTYRGVDAYPVYWDSFTKMVNPFFNQLKKK